uniref:UPF0251 protein ENR59_03650 n=1 Tax=Fundidesulfovibrio putealis TaxID=270496 RepID=A0A7C4AC68_9BACT
MPRPRKRRCLGEAPPATMYKPQGVPMGRLKGVVLPAEGFEALRLVDALGMAQEEAAERMGVSRPTVCRILGEARAAVARALANGWAIRIEAGAPGEEGQGQDAHACRKRGRGCAGGPRDEDAPDEKEDL